MGNNPVKNTDPLGDVAKDPDDIYLNAKGEVAKVVETNKPNRFFDDKGTELNLNDGKGLDSPMLVTKFDEGDKIYEPIGKSELQGVINATKKQDFNEVKYKEAVEVGFYMVKYAMSSHGRYDFGHSYLRDRLGVSHSDMGELYYGSGFVYGVPFVRFEGNNTLYNLPDAGNFMWGKKAKANNLPKSVMLMGADYNEFGKDTPADTRAILSGYSHQ